MLDAVLAANVLHMMSQLGQSTRVVHERLELAFLNFMQQFRKVYIGKFCNFLRYHTSYTNAYFGFVRRLNSSGIKSVQETLGHATNERSK